MDGENSQPPRQPPDKFDPYGPLTLSKEPQPGGGPYMPAADACALLGRMLYTSTMDQIRSNPSAPKSLKTTKLNPFKPRVIHTSWNTYLIIRAKPEDVGGEERLERITRLVEWLFSTWVPHDGGKTKFRTGRLIRSGLENFVGVRMMLFIVGFRKIEDAKQASVKSEDAKEASCTSEPVNGESGKNSQNQHEEQTISTGTDGGKVIMSLPFRPKP